MTIEDLVRSIVREELVRAGVLPAPLPSPRSLPGLVLEFAASLLPGEVVRAHELYRRYRAWTLEHEVADGPPTLTAFGRALTRTGRVERRRDASGRRYVVLPLGAPAEAGG